MVSLVVASFVWIGKLYEKGFLLVVASFVWIGKLYEKGFGFY